MSGKSHPNSCYDGPNLSEVLKAGNRTGCSDIYVSRGSKITSQDLVLEGTKSITLQTFGELFYNVGDHTIKANTLNLLGRVAATLAGSQLYLNAGPELAKLFGSIIPPLATTIGGQFTVESDIPATFNTPSTKFTGGIDIFGDGVDLFGDGAGIRSDSNLELAAKGALNLNVVDLTGQVTGAIKLAAQSIEHNTPAFSVIGQKLSAEVEDLTLSTTTFAVASKTYSTLYAVEYVNAGATDKTQGATTLAGLTTYINAGPHLSDFFGNNIPDLTTIIGGDILQITSRTIVFDSNQSINLTAPNTTINGDLTVNGKIINNDIESAGDLQLSAAGDLKLDVTNLTGQVTGAIKLAAQSIEHNTPLFNVLSQKLSATVDEFTLNSNTLNFAISNSALAVAQSDIVAGVVNGNLTLGGLIAYINAGPGLNQIFGDNIPFPLSTIIGGDITLDGNISTGINKIFNISGQLVLNTSVYNETTNEKTVEVLGQYNETLRTGATIQSDDNYNITSGTDINLTASNQVQLSTLKLNLLGSTVTIGDGSTNSTTTINSTSLIVNNNALINGDLTVLGTIFNNNIQSAGDLSLGAAGDLKLDVTNLTGQVTGAIKLAAESIEHNTPLFNVLSEKLSATVNDFTLNSKTLNFATDSGSFVGQSDIVAGTSGGNLTLGGPNIYINTGDALTQIFGPNIPPNLTTTIGGNIVLNGDINLNGNINVSSGSYTENLTLGKSSNITGDVNETVTRGNISVRLDESYLLNAGFNINIISQVTTQITAGLFQVSSNGINLYGVDTINIGNPTQLTEKVNVNTDNFSVNGDATINGDLTVTGKIINPPAASVQFTYITADNENAGPTIVSIDWTNLSMFNEISVQGLDVTHQPDGGIKFAEPGWYRLDGFTTHHADSTEAKFVTRLSNLSGVMSNEGLLRGTPVAGSGVSIIKGKINVTDVSLPWYFQYKTNTAHPNGLGLASGLDSNIYSMLDITRI